MTTRSRRVLADELSLDSLMDILTCSVGLLMMVVVLALMQARESRISVHMPLAQDPPQGAARRILVCKDGRVRLMDFDGAVDHLLASGTVTFDGVPDLVTRANAKPFTDGYFDYAFEYSDEHELLLTRRKIEITIKERTVTTGHDLEELEERPSGFREMVMDLARKERIWIAFHVDQKSLAVFREARAIIADLGIATGWDPGDMSFPHKQTVLGGGPRGSAGPRRVNLGTTQ
jgi:hypothetical protein